MKTFSEIMTEVFSRDRLKPQRMMASIGVKFMHVEGAPKKNALGLNMIKPVRCR